MGTNGVLANLGWHDERLDIMDDERLESGGGTFDHHLFTLHQIQNVNSPVSVVRNNARKPVAASFDEFKFVESGVFFAPPCTGAKRFNPVNQ